MKQETGNIAFKIILAYVLLAIVALLSIIYAYDIVKQFANQTQDESIPQKKNYYITQTFSLLYASEAQGQIIGMTASDYNRYNKTLNQAEDKIDSLQMILVDSLQILKIDTIKQLITRKRYNTKQLIKSNKESSTEELYQKNIEQLIAIQDTVIQEKQIEQRIETIQDTLIVKKKPKNFFKRIASAFIHSDTDTTTVVNITQQIHNDTIIQKFNPSDSIIRLFKDIQTNVALQRKELDLALIQKANNLRYNNSLLNQKINHLLREIEQEAIDTSLKRTEENQLLFNRFIKQLREIGLLALLIAIFSLFIIVKDLAKSNYYKKQLMQSKLHAETLMAHREQLMLTISHDIRTPLSSIMGYIELITNLKPQPREQYYLTNMQSSASHILSLANDLLDYHRLESNKMEINRVSFDLEELVSDITISFAPLAEAKNLNIKLEINKAEQPFLYIGDKIKIRQIIGNLLSNAIKFSKQGEVILNVCQQQNIDKQPEVTFTVTDNGPGISLSDQKLIFNEFAQLSSENKAQGFGLGLTITRKLTHLLGGKLSLQSEINKGSSFKVYIPLTYSTEIKQLKEASTPLSVIDETTITCLLVDDDPIQLAMVETILKQQGINVVSCIESINVPTLLAQQNFDLVITDIQMPNIDGIALLHLVRNSTLTNAAHIPVIALSGNVAQNDAYYETAGFSAFLAKPFTSSNLLHLIQTTLQAAKKQSLNYHFNALTAFAAGDATASITILKTFYLETLNNIELLLQYQKSVNKSELAKLAHKLQPILNMIGAENTVTKLRKLQEEELSTQAWQELINEIILEMRAIATALMEEIGE